MTKTLLSLLLEELRRLPRLPRRFQFDAALLESLRQVAEREQRSEDEVAADLLESALAQHGAHEARIQVWESLSPREQEVVALACLGHTNRQIAAQLYTCAMPSASSVWPTKPTCAPCSPTGTSAAGNNPCFTP